jgi:hypothetical protein
MEVVVFAYSYFGQPGKDGFQQFVLVVGDEEKPRVETELFDTSAQGGLRVARQMLGIVQHDGFEMAVVADVGLGVKL